MTEHSRPAMSRAHRAYVIATCAIIGGAFAYAACDWGHWPHLVYLPLHGRLALGATTPLAIHYVGLVAWGAGGACAGAVVGAVVCRARPRPWSPRTYQLFGAWAITALVLAGGYFTWNLWPW
ncbi:MAG TPA: hypothetical protein VK607_06665 [Kofleriaceae bacterium]|nr:hypothetical protein [Kofleriaceae bacterium]